MDSGYALCRVVCKNKTYLIEQAILVERPIQLMEIFTHYTNGNPKYAVYKVAFVVHVSSYFVPYSCAKALLSTPFFLKKYYKYLMEQFSFFLKFGINSLLMISKRFLMCFITYGYNQYNC
jgi:hypothetical protein